jgi:hypothetical protein
MSRILSVAFVLQLVEQEGMYSVIQSVKYPIRLVIPIYPSPTIWRSVIFRQSFTKATQHVCVPPKKPPIFLLNFDCFGGVFAVLSQGATIRLASLLYGAL